MCGGVAGLIELVLVVDVGLGLDMGPEGGWPEILKLRLAQPASLFELMVWLSLGPLTLDPAQLYKLSLFTLTLLHFEIGFRCFCLLGR